MVCLHFVSTPLRNAVHMNGRMNIRIACAFVQLVIFSCACLAVAFGLYVPSQRSRRCRLYHCAKPNSLDSLFATAPATSLRPSSISPTTVELTLCARPLRKEPTEVAEAAGDAEVDVETRF